VSRGLSIAVLCYAGLTACSDNTADSSPAADDAARSARNAALSVQATVTEGERAHALYEKQKSERQD